MTRLNWTLESTYEAGLDRGVFYMPDGSGEVWDGLVAVKESPSDGTESVRYIDGQKILNQRRGGQFAGSIEAFSLPVSFYQDRLLQLGQKAFGLSYRVTKANSYEIHLVYNVLSSPMQRTYAYDEVEPISFDFTTRPVSVPYAKPTAHLIVDSSDAYSATMTALEDVLYGSESSMPYLPLPVETFDIFEANSILRVTDNGDGSFTVEGPDTAIQMLDPTTFQIDWPSANYINTESYTLQSL